MTDMIRRQILPAASSYAATLCRTIAAKEGRPSPAGQKRPWLPSFRMPRTAFFDHCNALEETMLHLPQDRASQAMYYCKTVIPAMDAARADADRLETLTDKSYWPYPTYSDLLFYV